MTDATNMLTIHIDIVCRYTATHQFYECYRLSILLFAHTLLTVLISFVEAVFSAFPSFYSLFLFKLLLHCLGDCNLDKCKMPA